MLRSIFSKGLEALVLEFLVAGRRSGIQADLWQEVTELIAANPFEAVAAKWVQTHAGACERRYHELLQVSRVMRELRLEPVMNAASTAFFERSCAMGLRPAFTEKPDDPDPVIEYLEQRLDKGFPVRP